MDKQHLEPKGRKVVVVIRLKLVSLQMDKQQAPCHIVMPSVVIRLKLVSLQMDKQHGEAGFSLRIVVIRLKLVSLQMDKQQYLRTLS